MPAMAKGEARFAKAAFWRRGGRPPERFFCMARHVRTFVAWIISRLPRGLFAWCCQSELRKENSASWLAGEAPNYLHDGRARTLAGQRDQAEAPERRRPPIARACTKILAAVREALAHVVQQQIGVGMNLGAREPG